MQPHITKFDNWTHLVAQLDSANLPALHDAMVSENVIRAASLQKDWSSIIRSVHEKNQRQPRKALPQSYAEAVKPILGGFSTVMAT